MVLECKHVWEHISGYLDATLPPDVLEQVQKHLEHCEICSAILDSTRNILILTADERVFELPLALANGCMPVWKRRYEAWLPKHCARCGE